MLRHKVMFVCSVVAGLAFGLPAAATAQGPHPGRIIGRVLDAETGRPLPGAQITVQGTRIGTLAGVGGRYLLLNVPGGTQTLVVSYIGYAPKSVTDVAVAPGAAVNLDVTLQSSAVAIEGITVSAERERGSVSRALDEQRRAVGVVNAITSEQISRSPDGDAAAAVQRVSGVTVQDGKFVFVRGLGERYTTTSLNGARIPSPEPERKMVPLDLFPSGLLQTITTSKTFTPNQPGDFSGAQVNIRTREFPAKRQVTYSYSAGFNTAAFGQNVLAAPTEGMEWLAFGSRSRGLPETVDVWGRFDRSPRQDDYNEMVNSFRNVWSPQERTGLANQSFGVSVGGNDDFFGRTFGYLASGTYSFGQEVRRDEVRAVALAGTAGETREINRFEGETGTSSVLWGGLLNMSTQAGANTHVSFNNSYNRSADHDARREEGYSENLGIPLLIDRLRYVERDVRSTQLLIEHQLTSRSRLDGSLTSSGVRRREPDRSEMVYVIEHDAAGRALPPVWFSIGSEAAVRTFGDLSEDSFEGATDYQLTLGNLALPHTLKFGAMGRWTGREAGNRAYSLSAPRLAADRDQVELSPEEIFDGRFAGPSDSYFLVAPLGQGGSYAASDLLFAGYGMLEYALSNRVQLVGGARVEHSQVAVNAEPTIGAVVRTRPSYTDVLPSLALNYRFDDRQNLRFSASQTLARPEYRELAGIQYREVIGGENVLGNPQLRRTLIQNLDARWEWYPNPYEIFSVALFAKRFQDPIERVYLGGSGTRLITFLNADEAYNYGVELEARKGLGTVRQGQHPFTVFANATLMHSDIRIAADGRASITNPSRPMVAQAPYVLNTGITYASPTGRASTMLLYNVVGERIRSASEAPLPDEFERHRHMLDLSLRFPLWGSMVAKFDAKNLLDSPYEVTQGSVLREYYRSGRVLSLGVNWNR